MASERQKGFFKELLEQRQFPDGTDNAALLAKFDALSQDAASNWIEKAMELPKKGATEGSNEAPPF